MLDGGREQVREHRLEQDEVDALIGAREAEPLRRNRAIGVVDVVLHVGVDKDEGRKADGDLPLAPLDRLAAHIEAEVAAIGREVVGQGARHPPATAADVENRLVA